MAGSNSSPLSNVEFVKQFSDLTLTCEGESFKAHKTTVGLHSPVMARALSGQFIEAKTNEIVISCDLPSAKRMIDFMYTGDYGLHCYTASDVLSAGPATKQDSAMEGSGEGSADEAQSENPTTITEELNGHGRVNSIADYYGIAALGALSTEKTRQVLETKWSAKDFCDYLRESTGSTGDARLHNMLAEIAMQHIQEVVKNGFFDDTSVVRELSPYLMPKMWTSVDEAITNKHSAAHEREELEECLEDCESLLEKFASCKHPGCKGGKIEGRRPSTLGHGKYYLICTKCGRYCYP